jgi:dihydropteroate synthase
MKGNHAVIIENKQEAVRCLKEIGVDPGAYKYLVPKAIHRCVKLKNLSSQAANIIKQEMLSKGGDAALNRSAILLNGHTDVLLMGSLNHYQRLVEKLKLQPFGLKQVAEEIETILNCLEPTTSVMELPSGQSLELGKRTLIMGILNVTPDSFSDGGRYFGFDKAIAHAHRMMEEGADIIDIGGASSRPGALSIDPEQELERVVPVVKRLARDGLVISVDTFRAVVAESCLDAGASIINDIGRLQFDPQMLPVLVKRQAPVVLMHNRLQNFNQSKPASDVETGINPRYDDMISEIISELEQSIDQAVNAGLNPNRIIIDPGIGFGKNAYQNCLIIKRLKEFKSLGKPLLIGASRKSFIGEILGLKVEDRLEGSLAALSMGVTNGADIVRVHDVAESKRAARMTDAVWRENG